MKREPAFLDNCFKQFPRTARHDGHAIYQCRQPLHVRVLTFLVLWGWLFLLGLLIALALSGCDTDPYEPVAVQAAREDAEAKASREWVGQQVCGPRATPEWLDDKTLRCLRNADRP